MISDIGLREVIEGDLPLFFTQQQDPDANWMAAFTANDPDDWDTFITHWTMILGDETIIKRTILFNGQVPGNIVCFSVDGQYEVGYWLGKEYWGQGIATRALALFLEIIPFHPLYAHVAKDNLASLHVLQKCGFIICGEGSSFSPARGVEVAEFVLISK